MAASRRRQTAGMDYSDRLQAAMTHAKKSRQDLKREVGVSLQAIGQVINRQSKGFGIENNSKVARCLGVSSDWLATGDGNMIPAAAFGETLTAQSMSYMPVTVPYLTREELMQSQELPASFWLELPDDALAPTAPKGTRAIFEIREPAWGDAVLLFDGKGEPHVRVYRQSFEHDWEGHAANPHFAPLTSSTPGVRVVAVLESLGGGWARLSR